MRGALPSVDEFLFVAIGVPNEDEVNPDSIVANSVADTRGCCAGVSRAARNQIPPATKPIIEQTRNEQRQP